MHPEIIFRIVSVNWAHESTHHCNEKTSAGNIAVFLSKENYMCKFIENFRQALDKTRLYHDDADMVDNHDLVHIYSKNMKKKRLEAGFIIT